MTDLSVPVWILSTISNCVKQRRQQILLKIKMVITGVSDEIIQQLWINGWFLYSWSYKVKILSYLCNCEIVCILI